METEPGIWKLNGFGFSLWPGIALYEGYHKDDWPHGRGRMIHFNGSYHLGNFENGTPSG